MNTNHIDERPNGIQRFNNTPLIKTDTPDDNDNGPADSNECNDALNVDNNADNEDTISEDVTEVKMVMVVMMVTTRMVLMIMKNIQKWSMLT